MERIVGIEINFQYLYGLKNRKESYDLPEILWNMKILWQCHSQV